MDIVNDGIAENYSPERVARYSNQYGLETRMSLDLTTGWDFTLEVDRRMAWERITSEKP